MDLTRDLSLAFVGLYLPVNLTSFMADYLPASGDLRHVVRTVNALGNGYSGRLNIVLNDLTAPIVSRNLILLLVLCSIPDEVMAADIALHFWYSVFMPVEYRIQISAIISSLSSKVNPGQLLTADL